MVTKLAWERIVAPPPASIAEARRIIAVLEIVTRGRVCEWRKLEKRYFRTLK